MTGRRRTTGAVKIVVTGPYAAGKTTLIRTISEIEVVSTERATSDEGRAVKAGTTVAMDFGRIAFADDLVLYLFGTPGQERFDFMWEVLGEGMLGYVLVVDGSSASSLREAAPILAAFRRLARVPHVVAVNRSAGLTAEQEAHVRRELALSDTTGVVACDATDRASVKTVLLALLVGALEALDAPAGVG